MRDERGSFRSALLIPARTDPPFVITLLRRDREFDPADTTRYAALGALVAGIHEEDRALFRANERLATIEERFQAHEDLHPALASARDAAALLESATRAIAQRFQAAAASVMLVDPSGELRVRAAVGLAPEVVRDTHRRLGEGIAGWVAEHGEPVLLNGPVDDWRFRGVDPHAGAALSVPLRVGTAVVGVLNVKRAREGGSFDESHLRVLEAIGADLSAALLHVEAIERLEGDLRAAIAVAEIAGLAGRGDRAGAARVVAETLGSSAVGVAGPQGIEVLHGDAAALRTPETERVGTPSGDVLLSPAPRTDEERALAERIAPMLAPRTAPPEPRGDPAPPRHVPRVFVVEDHPIVREGLKGVLERDGDLSVCGNARTLAEAVAALPEARADVVLYDLHLPDADGVDSLPTIERAAGRVPVVVFTVDASLDVAAAALRAGARGFIPKRASPSEIRAGVRAAAEGIVALHPDVAGAVEPPEPGAPDPEARARLAASSSEPREPLTPRELEYLRYLAEGYTNKEIARVMVLAEDTVKKGVQALIAKLGAVDRTHAVVIALRQDLIR